MVDKLNAAAHEEEQKLIVSLFITSIVLDACGKFVARESSAFPVSLHTPLHSPELGSLLQ